MGGAFFVTGTDTEVGKTMVSVLLMHALQRQGLQVLGMKPVASGCLPSDEGLISEDAEALASAASLTLPKSLINPYTFEDPISPHLAARDANTDIDLWQIAGNLNQLRQQADIVLVEGAGGWFAPISDERDMADLAMGLQLPVVLVVGMKLGCINHALLTAKAIEAKGCRLIGWVANRVEPRMLRFEDNLKTLTDRIGAPLLGVIPYLENEEAASQAVDNMAIEPLLSLTPATCE